MGNSHWDRLLRMKKIAIFAAVSVFILLLTKMANQMPAEPEPGANYTLRAQKVIQCSQAEVTLVDNHLTPTHLDIDSSWPDCSTFTKDESLDFFLTEGARTHFLKAEKTAWWRKPL